MRAPPNDCSAISILAFDEAASQHLALRTEIRSSPELEHETETHCGGYNEAEVLTMKTVAWIALLILLLSGVSSLAYELKETNIEITVAADPETGQSRLRFTVWLEYAPVPRQIIFNRTWTTFVQDGSVQTVLEIAERLEFESPGVRRLYSTSPWIPIEAGKHYGASLHYEDTVNGVAYDRTLTYIAPVSLPTGIRLRGWDGSETIDLSQVPDEEIEELALYHSGLSNSYTTNQDTVSLNSLLEDIANADDSFPVAIFLVPTAGLQVLLGTSGQRGTLNVSQFAYLYVLPGEDAIGGFLDQLEFFDREFNGIAFVSTGGTPVLGAQTVFVDTMSWEILKAASLELSSRQADS
jgi:hypothetical protein